MRIAPFLTDLRDDIPLGTTINPIREGLDLLVSSIATKNVELDTTGTRNKILGTQVFPWIDCDALKLGGSLRRECKGLKKGEEMMACGRVSFDFLSLASSRLENHS